jgi:cobyrinic acid a,c-diamide synthase
MNVVVSAAGTGVGKTLVARALCVAFADRGYRVQPYKIGPDYIDARLYAALCGRPAYNIDLWLDGAEGVRRHVAATKGDAEVAVFEGMMGLFDGDVEGTTSTAEIARLLDAQVVLVLDGWTASQTLAAVALGLRSYDRRVRIAGAILNRCGGPSHEAAVRRACERIGVPILAAIPHDAALAVRERHLGLDAADAQRSHEALLALGRRLSETLDFAVTLRLSKGGRLDGLDATTCPSFDRIRMTARVRIGVAEDEAFWFTYPETLDALRAAGAEVVPFSPLRDAALPDAIAGLWLSGGYPELHAAALSANATMRAAIRNAIAGGLPTYAECGGHMYLAQWLETADGRYPMVGTIDGGTSMVGAALTIGYRTARACSDTPLDRAGDEIRGYAFHYARPFLVIDEPAYRFENGLTDGIARATLLSSFLHRHVLPGDPAALRFVAWCRSQCASAR